MKLGVTAARGGQTGIQITETANQLTAIRRHVDEVHHGDCKGGDKEIHGMVSMWNVRIIGHPPKINSMRAYCRCDELRPTQDFVTRDHNIVRETGTLLAAPAMNEEANPRSGTWTTIRYARQLGRPVVIIYPDGNVTYERWTWDC